MEDDHSGFMPPLMQTLVSAGGSAVPVICGYNTGQHVYIDASDSCNSINLDMDTGSSQNRKWQFRVCTCTVC